MSVALRSAELTRYRDCQGGDSTFERASSPSIEAMKSSTSLRASSRSECIANRNETRTELKVSRRDRVKQVHKYNVFDRNVNTGKKRFVVLPGEVKDT